MVQQRRLYSKNKESISMSKKIYISPIIEIESFQMSLEICAGSPCIFCDSDPCVCNTGGDSGIGGTDARARGGYYDAPVQQAEFGNLW